MNPFENRTKAKPMKKSLVKPSLEQVFESIRRDMHYPTPDAIDYAKFFNPMVPKPNDSNPLGLNPKEVTHIDLKGTPKPNDSNPLGLNRLEPNPNRTPNQSIKTEQLLNLMLLAEKFVESVANSEKMPYTRCSSF